jgi:hypothetical protein
MRRRKFESETDICADRHLGNVMSRAANPSRKAKERMRARMLAHWAAVTDATPEEVELTLNMGLERTAPDYLPRQSASARASELVRDGLIVPVLDGNGKPVRRRTLRGRFAQVFRAVTKEEKKARKRSAGSQSQFPFGDANVAP